MHPLCDNVYDYSSQKGFSAKSYRGFVYAGSQKAKYAYDIFRKKAKSSILLYLLMGVVALVAFIHIGAYSIRYSKLEGHVGSSIEDSYTAVYSTVVSLEPLCSKSLNMSSNGKSGPSIKISDAYINQIISALKYINSKDAIPDGGDMVELGNIARTYQKAFDIYYQLVICQYDSATRTRMEDQLFQLEKKLYPWIINGPMYHSAVESLLKSRGRGIVMTTGSKYALVAQHSITMLNFIGNQLPIEIIYCGEDDLGQKERDALTSLHRVTLVDMQSVLGLKKCSKGWENKPLAVLASSFQQVILMDTDALFFQHPETLFETKAYKETGALFFRDRTLGFGTYGHGPGLTDLINTLAEPFKENLIFNTSRVMAKVSSDELDSGVVVWDKTRSMPAILLTCALNSMPYMDLIYSKTYGDKETYWLSHEALQIPFTVFLDNGGAIGKVFEQEGKHKVCGGLYHADEHGKPLWFNGGIGERIPSKNLNMMEPTYWATESAGVNVDWELSGLPFCLYGKMDAPGDYRDSRIGKLSSSELVISKKMVDLWVELFQL
ncbi:hypothetical protein O5D80_001961 [Batrachochytrium dendrobatidis]|nr:hypothetical protein O5D80_001961 [Batrachochytrium dendrobatidis]